VGVPLHDPGFILDIPDAAERTGARDVQYLAQVPAIVFQSLLADDDVPATGDRRHHETRRARIAELELDRVLVRRGDLADRAEQHAARNADALRRLADAVERRLDVLGRELCAVMERDTLAQEEGVGLAVLRDLPAVRQIRDDGLAAVT